ncbi:hypothetical protein SARC_08665 [Sphaeroforma arctica JP610]|uniref:26S proteasome regulatory subunit Rpn7 N-terminal domain-containing protein n=1 Tax=Sphaeroforma arctica JP610 TaxID=667725 RepID=A0A0L0FQ35_9EUKA|nr:hypothetical protein SARC_08665 [Sphaeroforma arctica JP610]KNC78920.1 hypothetical protein SARC_08665 [Sphaeroforma arctica JP610]|eukprot:XP_014152822.1 hypothetical protein SARC_08665 [Sphaeroforma arctica JP610]
MYDAEHVPVEDAIEMSDTGSIDETELEDAPDLVVTDASGFDLEAYVSNFSGMALIDRMVFIASRAPSLKVEALTIALKTIKGKTTSTKLYREVWRKLYPDYDWESHTGETPDAPQPDHEWVSQTLATAQVELADRERDIKTGKSKNLKASVWIGYTDLANFHFLRGEWAEASKNYMRARDYISSVANEVKVCEGAVRAYAQLNDWREVANFVMRAERVKGFDKMEKLVSRMKCYLGVSHLMRGEYKSAAQLFAGVHAEFISDWTEMMTPRTLALYGGLTLMATMDRPVFRRIMESVDFRAILTHAPEMQGITKAFYSSKYSECLRRLTSLQTDLLLDFYLSRHVNALLKMIREKRRTHAGILCSRMAVEDLHVGSAPSSGFMRFNGGSKTHKEARAHPRGSRNAPRSSEGSSSRPPRPLQQEVADGDLEPEVHSTDTHRVKGEVIGTTFEGEPIPGHHTHSKNPKWSAAWDDGLKLDMFLSL